MSCSNCELHWMRGGKGPCDSCLKDKRIASLEAELQSVTDQRDSVLAALTDCQANYREADAAMVTAGLSNRPDTTDWLGEQARFLPAKDAEIAALKAQIDEFWLGLENEYEVEDRAYFEAKYAGPSILGIALHYVWKRDPKVATLRAALLEMRDALEDARSWMPDHQAYKVDAVLARHAALAKGDGNG